MQTETHPTTDDLYLPSWSDPSEYGGLDDQQYRTFVEASMDRYPNGWRKLLDSDVVTLDELDAALDVENQPCCNCCGEPYSAGDVVLPVQVDGQDDTLLFCLTAVQKLENDELDLEQAIRGLHQK